MPRLLTHLRRRQRPLLLGLCAGVMFGLWFGVWVRVLPVRPRVVIRPGDSFSLVGFSPDAKTLLTHSDWRTIETWDIATGGKLKTHDRSEVQPLGGYSSSSRLIEKARNPRLCSFLDSSLEQRFFSASPAGQIFAVSYFDRAPRIRVWDFPADEPRYELETACSLPICFSPKGKTLAFLRQGSPDLEIVLADAENGNAVGHMRWPKSSLLPISLSFSPDGEYLAAASKCFRSGVWRDRVTVWSTQSCREIAFIDDARLFAFSADGGYLACAHEIEVENEPVLKVWNTRTWNEHLILRPYPADLRGWASPQFVPGTNLMMIAYSRDPERNVVVKWLSEFSRHSNEDGQARNHVYEFVDAGSGRRCGQILHNAPAVIASLSPDGRFVAVQSHQPGDNEIHLYDLPPRRPVELYLLLSALPALLFTGLLWWRVR